MDNRDTPQRCGQPRGHGAPLSGHLPTAVGWLSLVWVLARAVRTVASIGGAFASGVSVNELSRVGRLVGLLSAVASHERQREERGLSPKSR